MSNSETLMAVPTAESSLSATSPTVTDAVTDVVTDAAWWDKAIDEHGVTAMDRLIAQDATWDDVRQSGRSDLRQALELTQVVPGDQQTVVDIGCGLGRMSQALGEYYGRVIGVDVSSRLLEQARERNTASHITFQQLTPGRLSWPDQPQVDVVFSYEVLYLLPHELLATYLKDALALLKPGGLILFQLNLNPVRPWTHVARGIRRGLASLGVKEWRGWPTTIPRRYAYDREWVCNELRSAGFTGVNVFAERAAETWFTAHRPRR